jgi:hypothetical protein
MAEVRREERTEAPAQRLWKRLGFEPVGALADPLAEGLEGACRSGLQAIAKLAVEA